MAAADLEVEHWRTAYAADLYEVARWGNGYFSVGPNGHLLVHPHKDPTRSIDLKQLVDRLQVRASTFQSCSDSPRSSSTGSAKSRQPSRLP